jgi:heme A synthase
MYPIVLAIHSLARWFVLTSLLIAIFQAYKGWFTNKPYSKFDNSVRHITATIAHIQLIIGLWLYFISPIIDYFLHNYKEAVHQREIRFFGMEHNLMMLTAIIIITIGSAKAKRKPTDKEKFKTMALWFAVGFLIILLSIPWSFSPLASRPLFRQF